MAMLWTFHALSLCRHVYRELLRSAVLDVHPIIPATACHQRNYVERYSRFIRSPEVRDPLLQIGVDRGLAVEAGQRTRAQRP